MNAIDRSQLQGLFASGYGRQKAFAILLAEITDPDQAKSWLKALIEKITFFGQKGGTAKINIAFSHPGLARLGLGDEALAHFSDAFRDGMVTPHRQRILGDLAESGSDPRQWRWGGPDQRPPHLALLVYESTPTSRDRLCQNLRERWRGLEEIAALPSDGLNDGREHFGFQDGLSQPIIEGLNRKGPARDTVAAGEFILGYADETGALEPCPDIAKNGTYLVIRQLIQDVPGFWGQFEALGDENGKIALAAKMMGRWPDGTPVALAPQPPEQPDPTNEFTFRPEAVPGARCPLGSHIRRANPRDGLLPKAGDSIKTVKRHRLLRRGRTFGPPAPAEVYPGDLSVGQAADRGQGERGLYFICLNASIERQFEFVQSRWLNNPKFLGLSSETDPIACPFAWQAPGLPPVFTVQSQPLRKRFALPQRFVQTVGGAYFFLPSRHMLEVLTA